MSYSIIMHRTKEKKLFGRFLTVHIHYRCCDWFTEVHWVGNLSAFKQILSIPYCIWVITSCW